MQSGTSELHEVVNIQPQISHSTELLVPVPTLAPLPEESTEDWDERMGDLFEWVGMACLGSQRSVSMRHWFFFQLLTKGTS
jgi:ribonuclease P/MRP protein subunit RPP40